MTKVIISIRVTAGVGWPFSSWARFPYRCGGSIAEPQPDVPTFPLSVPPSLPHFHLLLSIQILNTGIALSLFQLSTEYLLLLVLPASPSCSPSAVQLIRCLVMVGTFYKQGQTDRTTWKRKNKMKTCGCRFRLLRSASTSSAFTLSEEGGRITQAALCQRSGNDEEY